MQCVNISFDCIPLRIVARLDAPLDAAPDFEPSCQRLKRALEIHGEHNSYYLYNGCCEFWLCNDPAVGTIAFSFHGTVLTNAEDTQTRFCQLHVELQHDTCEWLTPQVIAWFRETVTRAVAHEFDKYAATGDLPRTHERLKQIEEECNSRGGYIAMGL
jgi:hypothetical protein